MNTTDMIAIGFFIATAFLLFFGIRSWLYSTPTSKAKAGPSATTTAGTTPSTASATPAPPTSPSPLPPTPAAKSYDWMRTYFIMFLAALIALAIYHKILVPGLNFPGPSPRATAPPRVTAPKKELQKPVVVCRPIEFAGGKKAVRRQNTVDVQKGGYADFEIDHFPYREDGRYQVVFQIICQSTAEHHLKIESWPMETFDFRHSKIGQPEMVVFFGDVAGGRKGEPRFFRRGKINFRLWSDDDITMLSSHVELVYQG